MSVRPIFCGLLLAACLPAAARDARAPDAADAPPCPSASANVADASEPAFSGHRRAPAGSASKTRPAASGGVDGESPTRGPRWHSFLPGMFR